MEDLELMAGRDRKQFWSGKRVLVTGHTGFIGGWLCHMLISLGARVTGYSDSVPTQPSLFEAAHLAKHLHDQRGDIANVSALTAVFREAQPEIVLHLAAQPLVRRAFKDPFETYRANVLGTLAVLEALRQSSGAAAAIFMTTDKVYLNKEWAWPYRETDALGGHEPYGLSKAMAEMAVAQFRETYFKETSGGVKPPAIVSVRAGNVFGGGDWSEDRLVPDAIRAWSRGEPLSIRSPKATRPWQHVADVADALLMLAERAGAQQKTSLLRNAYNIGPGAEAVVPVGELVEQLSRCWGKGAEVRIETPAWQAPESTLLSLDSTLFRSDFGWSPQIALAKGLEWTVDWYQRVIQDPDTAAGVTSMQIAELIDV